MAEIKFTTERMNQVNQRLDEMISQLKSSMNNANEHLNNISSNINTDKINKTLKEFVNSSKSYYYKTYNDLKALSEYLTSKIGTYTSVDEEAVQSMSEVQSFLDQLNN